MYRVSLHFPPFYLNTCLCELPSVRRCPAGPSRAAHVRRWQQSRTLRSTPALGCAGLLPAGRGRALPSPPEKGPRPTHRKEGHTMPHPPEGGARPALPTGRVPRPAQLSHGGQAHAAAGCGELGKAAAPFFLGNCSSSHQGGILAWAGSFLARSLWAASRFPPRRSQPRDPCYCCS